jgi:hypothetical protein
MLHLVASALLLTSALSLTADLATIDHTIAREPGYAGKLSRYALLVLGPDAIHQGSDISPTTCTP